MAAMDESVGYSTGVTSAAVAVTDENDNGDGG